MKHNINDCYLPVVKKLQRPENTIITRSSSTISQRTGDCLNMKNFGVFLNFFQFYKWKQKISKYPHRNPERSH